MVGVEIFSSVMLHCWNLLRFQVPGFDFTAQQFVLALFFMGLGCTALSLTLGVGGGTSQRSGHSGKHRTSEQRRHDTK